MEYRLKKEVLYVVLIAVFGGLVLSFSPLKNLFDRRVELYKDEPHKIRFYKPKSWQASSSQNFIKINSDYTKQDGINVLITVDPSQFFLDGVGLNDLAQEIKIGKKTLKITKREVVIPSDVKTSSSIGQKFQTVSRTNLLWKSDSHQYWFQISPAQGDKFDEDLYNLIASFKKT